MSSITKQVNVIETHNLELIYESDSRTVQALQNIHLKIEEGSFVCVLGPSGCGKTSLLRILAGFQQPTSGDILLDGKPMSPRPDRHRGVVFQQHTLYPWLTIEENVAFGLKMNNIKADERHRVVDHYLDMVGLSQFKRAATYELSGGMKQRASIARVLANNPRIVLMDEPFGALDPITKEQMQENVRKIWKDTHKTFFFITHDVEEALLLGTHIVVMSARPGRIVKEMKSHIPHELQDGMSRLYKSEKNFIYLREEILDIITH